MGKFDPSATVVAVPDPSLWIMEYSVAPCSKPMPITSTKDVKAVEAAGKALAFLCSPTILRPVAVTLNMEDCMAT